MLSATSSVADVKARLHNGYAFYGFSSDGAFVDEIEAALDEVRLSKLLPLLGEAQYNEIAAKDKIGLELRQEYIYWAEVYFAAGAFLRAQSDVDLQAFAGESTSESVDGVSLSVSGLSKNGKKTAAGSFFARGNDFLANAGYNRLQLVRGDTMLQPVQGPGVNLWNGGWL